MTTNINSHNNVLVSDDNNTADIHSNNNTLDDCFSRMSDEEQLDYYNDMVADYWIDVEKSNPSEYADCGL